MKCLHQCPCSSDEECQHFECFDPRCLSCYPQVEPTTDEEEDALVSPIDVVLRVSCPRCGEWAFQPCRDKHDDPAGDPHVERWGVAMALGLVTLPPLPAYLSATILEGALG